MTVVVAYVPVVHEGYRRFLERHAAGRKMYVIGPGPARDYRPLAKDVRALEPEDAARALGALGIAASVAVLDARGRRGARRERATSILPAEDVSYAVVERFFPRAAVRYDPAFLRWDKTRTVQLLDPRPERTVQRGRSATRELARAAEDEAARTIDWWRQVGAALRFADGTVAAAHNEHHPHPHAPYAAGDPRANFSQGRRAGAVDRHARRGRADRAGRARRPRHRRRRDLRHRLPLPAVREADRRRGHQRACTTAAATRSSTARTSSTPPASRSSR